MDYYGFWSLLPPLLAITLAVITRHVYISLLLGIWLGWTLIAGGNVIAGSIATIQGLVEVFKNEDSTRIILFSCLIGVLIVYIQRSGGVAGFIRYINHYLATHLATAHNKIKIQLLAFATGVIIFIETNLSILTVGAIFRPVFDKLKISREKLAYISDSTCSPVSILLPFNAWGAYIIGLLLVQNIADPFSVLLTSIVFNFYPILTLLIVLWVISSLRDLGPMRRAEQRTATGKLVSDNAQLLVSSDILILEKKHLLPARARNMLIPIITIVVMMPLLLLYTGWDATTELTDATLSNKLVAAINASSGSTAVLYAMLIAIIICFVLYRWQRFFSTQELTELAFKGLGSMLPLALLMLLAFAIGNVCRELGTGDYVAAVTSQWLSPSLIPMLLFLSSAIIASAIGTSFGTFAIMLAIGVPLAQSVDAHLSLTVAAVLSGGIFGDHCSPISDTTILSSMIAGTDHIDHVYTQLPYALLAGLGATVLFLIFGIVF